MSLNKIVILFFCSMALLGCGGKEEYKDLKEYVNTLKQSQPPKLQKNIVETINFPESVHYESDKMRQPFEGPSTTTSKTDPTNPLQAFPISALRFVGSTTSEQATSAYVLTPDNMIYQVKIADVIGDHYGKIISITPHEIKIMEQHTDDEGKPTQQLVVMQLKD